MNVIHFGREIDKKKKSVVTDSEDANYLKIANNFIFQAEKRFESAGRKFVEETLKLSKNLRPNAKWGYYAFPYCFGKGSATDCTSDVKKENDR